MKGPVRFRQALGHKGFPRVINAVHAALLTPAQDCRTPLARSEVTSVSMLLESSCRAVLSFL